MTKYLLVGLLLASQSCLSEDKIGNEGGYAQIRRPLIECGDVIDDFRPLLDPALAGFGFGIVYAIHGFISRTPRKEAP